MKVFELSKAESPMVISVPHDGALIPDDILAAMNPAVIGSTDRDYLIGEVFDFEGMSYSKIKANYSRHVIDLNRPASGEALYHGQTETELCPTSTFDCKAIYLTGQQPNQAEIRRRMELYWLPYHQQLSQLIERAKTQFGCCLLIDAHSIDDEVPRFFQGRLPDINVGTFNGKSCAPAIEVELINKLEQQNDFSHVINGRFKGGFITRNYGAPEQNIHAIQLEHAKSCYLNPQSKLSGKAEKLCGFWQETLLALMERVYKV